MNNLFKFCLLVFISLGLGSCSWLDEDVDRFITEEQALETPEDFEALLNSCYDVLANLYDGDVQIINEMRGDNLGQPNANLDYKAIYNRETIRWNTYVGGVNSDFYYPVAASTSCSSAWMIFQVCLRKIVRESRLKRCSFGRCAFLKRSRCLHSRTDTPTTTAIQASPFQREETQKLAT